MQHAVKELLGNVVEPAAMPLVSRPQEAAAQHGRERDGYHSGNENGRANGNGKFFEQAAQDAAHEQHRDKNAASDNVMDTMVKLIRPNSQRGYQRALAHLHVRTIFSSITMASSTTKPMEE